MNIPKLKTVFNRINDELIYGPTREDYNRILKLQIKNLKVELKNSRNKLKI